MIGSCLARDPAARPSPAQLIASSQAARAAQPLTLAGDWLPPDLAAELAGRAAVAPSPTAPAQIAPEPVGPATVTAAPARRPPAAGLEPAALASDLQSPGAVAEPGPVAQGAGGEPPVFALGAGVQTSRRRPSRTMVIAAAAALVLLVAVVGYSTRVLPDTFGLRVNGGDKAAAGPSGQDGPHQNEPTTGSKGAACGQFREGGFQGLRCRPEWPGR